MSAECNNLTAVGERKEEEEKEKKRQVSPATRTKTGTAPKAPSNIINRILFLGIETSVGIFQRIFTYLDTPTDYERFLYRRMCSRFRLLFTPTVPLGMFTLFPHPNYSTLSSLMNKLNDVYANDPRKAPKVVFVVEGTFHVNPNCTVCIKYPINIIGAGPNKTFLSGYRFVIAGTKEKAKAKEEDGQTRVVLKGMTSSGSHGNGLSFLCEKMTFTRCRRHGVRAMNTEGRLINCVITFCGGCGIRSSKQAVIEVEGSQTKVSRNVACGSSNSSSSYYGLHTKNSSSSIHLLYPLTKESVSFRNHGGRNYGNGPDWGDGVGAIRTVERF
jgi:hypothetical protein